jgi:hypothetical protein
MALSGSVAIVLLVLAALVVIPVLVVAIVYIVVPAFKGVGWLIRHVFRFVAGEVGDVLRAAGAVLTWILLVPLVLGNIVIGRWSAAAHFGRAMKAEAVTAARCLYRVAIGHPARLLGLRAVVEGLEERIPEAVAAAPGADRPSGGRAGQFDGYRIVGSLPGGGSGGRLYVAVPDAQRLAAFARQGQADVREVVIKSFSLKDGSSLPQIVRESRALDAARRLGLILEHQLTDERFFYVMRYVPGEPLGLVTQRLHAAAGSGGLAGRELAQALGFAQDLLRTLIRYHSGGLWHKDVKPDNIIVSDGRAHLVDFGLVTPLRSSMTLTTHGTEYFRDPEMVRMALKGVKVQDVDGTKFDVYAAGAVLYSMIENSFPAHGGLSQITRRCPEAVRWVVRRAMTDYDKRYESAAAMLRDVEAIAVAPDPFAVLPAYLPSVRSGGGATELGADAPAAGEAAAAPAAPAPTPVPDPAAVPIGAPAHQAPPANGWPAARTRARPDLRVTSWWTGRYVLAGSGRGAGAGEASHAAPAPMPAAAPPGVAATPASVRHSPRIPGRSAAAQLESARGRAAAAQARARQRMRGRGGERYVSGVNSGVAASLVFLLGVGVLAGFMLLASSFRTVPVTRGAGRNAIESVTTRGTVAVIVDRSTPGAPAAGGRAAAALSPAAARGRVFVIDDLASVLPDRREDAAALLARLRSAGFVVDGDAGTDEAGGTGESGAIERAASLRNAIGLSPFRSDGARDAIRTWLADHGDHAMVLWISVGDDRAPLGWLVAPESAGPGLLDAAAAALRGGR